MQLNNRNDATYWPKVPGLSGLLLIRILKWLLYTCDYNIRADIVLYNRIGVCQIGSYYSQLALIKCNFYKRDPLYKKKQTQSLFYTRNFLRMKVEYHISVAQASDVDSKEILPSIHIQRFKKIHLFYFWGEFAIILFVDF